MITSFASGFETMVAWLTSQGVKTDYNKFFILRRLGEFDMWWKITLLVSNVIGVLALAMIDMLKLIFHSYLSHP